MKTTIDAAGRIVIPASLRRAAGLRAGMELEVTAHDGVVMIEPAQMAVRMERRGRFVVAVPVASGTPPLTNDAVSRLREQLLDERAPD